MKIKFTFLFLLIVKLLCAQEIPFQKGVNLTGWFQVSNAQQIQFTKYTRKDFEQIKSLGCDVIRLPINLHFMTNGAPNYLIEPLFFDFLDHAVDWAEALGLHLILDNHTFDPSANTDPNVGLILEKVWLQMAQHYKDRSNLIYYEILNEPHGISDALWNAIQQNIIHTIRSVDTKHTIIVGPAGWNSYHNLAAMPQYDDDNLIYTFHFYDPFIFTHQGAGWVSPSMASLASVPFPHQASRMPTFPTALRGSWIENEFNNYNNIGTIDKIKELIDIAVAFKESRNVRIFCGEFGVYIPNSNNTDRVFWYETVRKYLEEKAIAWTTWDYHGGFGLFEEGGNDLFEHDLNIQLLQALGFNVPVQSEFVLQPDSIGFPIYTDYVEDQIFESSYDAGTLHFYEQNPAVGEHCIYWTSADQYNIIGFDFIPNKDLSYLLDNDFVLHFWVRCNTPGTTFDIRFLDTKTDDPGDRPWRMRVRIDESFANWNNQWHQVRIPLKDFEEHGAWDNGWYNPQGKFDWKAIDRFEIVAEQRALASAKLWFDEIRIMKEATTSTYDPDVITKLNIYPNPAIDFISIQSDPAAQMAYQLFDGAGKMVDNGVFYKETSINFTNLPSGIYFIRILDGDRFIQTSKIVK